MLSQILKTAFLGLLLSMTLGTYGQLTQTIRGTIYDQDSQAELVGASIKVLNSDPVQGTITDIDGGFRLEGVPVGRVSLLVTYIGYEEQLVPNVLVTAGKEVLLEVKLRESVEKLEAVVVTAKKDKSEVLNEMATVSARAFSVEETSRYAGALSDPARMVSAYAGVTSNTQGDNDIVVRGNSPRGILWRLEGIEIPNPNHFAGENTTGGPVNALNSNMLDDSDFYTGAFAPEYGNALSGVFDIHFKRGNNEQREYSFGASVFGVDFSAEGPFATGYNGSYLANYRYSSLQLISGLGFLDFGGIPKYQDASFNVELPLGKRHYLSMFGLGGLSSIYQESEDDEGNIDWKGGYHANVGVLGLTHTYELSSKSFIKSSFSLSGTKSLADEHLADQPDSLYLFAEDDISKVAYRFATTYNVKLSARHKVEAGLIYSILGYNASASLLDDDTDKLETLLSDQGSTSTLQAFATWKYRMGNAWTWTSGLHYLRFGLNGEGSLEPRTALRWDISSRHHATAGFGLHSRLEGVTTYLARHPETDTRPNRSLAPTKAAHFVLGYGHALSPNLNLKAEVYYQQLYSVPVENAPMSPHSVINYSGGFYTEPLVNKGTGRNYGLELTLERYFSKGLYYMGTLSLYRSLYTPIDGRERATAFDGRYVVNGLVGKEFSVGGLHSGRVLFVNAKVSLLGGGRYTPIDLQESVLLGEEVYQEERPYSASAEDVFFLNLSFGTRKDKGKTTRELKLDVMNVTNNQSAVDEYYDDAAQKIDYYYQLPILPNLVYTLKF